MGEDVLVDLGLGFVTLHWALGTGRWALGAGRVPVGADPSVGAEIALAFGLGEIEVDGPTANRAAVRLPSRWSI